MRKRKREREYEERDDDRKEELRRRRKGKEGSRAVETNTYSRKQEVYKCVRMNELKREER